MACLTSSVTNEFWIVGTDQNVISVNCHCCSLLHGAVSRCNQEMLKCFKKSPDLWVIDFVCMMLWLWNNHHFLFYFIFKKFESNIGLSSILRHAWAWTFLGSMCDFMWWSHFDSLFSFCALRKERLTGCFLLYVDKYSVRKKKRRTLKQLGFFFCCCYCFNLCLDVILEWGRRGLFHESFFFFSSRDRGVEIQASFCWWLATILIHFLPLGECYH